MQVKTCPNCGDSAAIKSHIVETCAKCGQESHDYETLEALKLELTMYKAAHRRACKALESELSGGKAGASHDGWLVKVSDIKEALMLEPELFPIEGGKA